jgi:translation elongation factor EF-1beta
MFETALANYEKQTGKDLSKHPFADKLRGCDSADSVLHLFQEQAQAFDEYRNGDRNLMKWLNQTVHLLHALTSSETLSEGVGLVFPPAKVVFSGICILLTAAKDVSASYDALVDLFECVEIFLKRLKIYAEIPCTPAMEDVIAKIMVELLSVLALATKQIKQGRFKKFAKKLLGESEIEAVLQRLDRLTKEEAQMTVIQTLEVVHGLVNSIKVVMDDGKASSENIRQALVTMHEVATEINKMKRSLCLHSALVFR